MKLQILYSTFRQVNLTPAGDSRSAKLAETGTCNGASQA
jgi:hypothetical protein